MTYDCPDKSYMIHGLSRRGADEALISAECGRATDGLEEDLLLGVTPTDGVTTFFPDVALAFPTCPSDRALATRRDDREGKSFTCRRTIAATKTGDLVSKSNANSSLTLRFQRHGLELGAPDRITTTYISHSSPTYHIHHPHCRRQVQTTTLQALPPTPWPKYLHFTDLQVNALLPLAVHSVIHNRSRNLHQRSL